MEQHAVDEAAHQQVPPGVKQLGGDAEIARHGAHVARPAVEEGEIVLENLDCAEARSRRRLQDVLTAIRLRTPLARCGRRLLANGERHLRARLRLAQLYPPALLAATVAIAERCRFSLEELRYEYPAELVPPVVATCTSTRPATVEAGAATVMRVGETTVTDAAGTVASSIETTVTVLRDTVAPTVKSVTPGVSYTDSTVLFSEAVTEATADLEELIQLNPARPYFLLMHVRESNTVEKVATILNSLSEPVEVVPLDKFLKLAASAKTYRTRFQQPGDPIDRAARTVTASYLVGCDGARSLGIIETFSASSMP